MEFTEEELKMTPIEFSKKLDGLMGNDAAEAFAAWEKARTKGGIDGSKGAGKAQKG